jgi:hypothetical protein
MGGATMRLPRPLATTRDLPGFIPWTTRDHTLDHPGFIPWITLASIRASIPGLHRSDPPWPPPAPTPHPHPRQQPPPQPLGPGHGGVEPPPWGYRGPWPHPGFPGEKSALFGYCRHSHFTLAIPKYMEKSQLTLPPNPGVAIPGTGRPSPAWGNPPEDPQGEL